MSTICRYLMSAPCSLPGYYCTKTPHQNFISPQESYLAPKLKQIVEYCRSSGTCEGLVELLEDVGAPGVYRFPVFEKNFCEELVEELEHFEESSAPKGRPNTMNHYG
ncbi:hypothetical protein CHARACLAT_033275, partial [Characodon lateralis]|nr:hypothetical protein [Characodon lateralis]